MTSVDKDPRGEYLSLVSIDESRVNLSPPIVFLFGGPIGQTPPTTVRGILYNHILVKRPELSEYLVIPEDFKDWLHDSVYPDLLLFESDLAQASSLVIIALESPGSIAELASFSVNNDLKGKVITILSEHHHNQESFIKLGPLRQIKDQNIYAYPYEHKRVKETLIDIYIEDIVSNILNRISETTKTEIFNKTNNGHIALLMFEMILIFKALKITEIQIYLSVLAININLKSIKRLLFLLEKLSLIQKKRLSNIDFFLPLKSHSRINFASDSSKKRIFDKNAAIIASSEYYASSESEKLRKRLLGMD